MVKFKQMNGYKQLTTPIVKRKEKVVEKFKFMTVDGFTKHNGCPIDTMIMLKGENIWRRVWCRQFSNVGTLHIKVGKEKYVVGEYDIPELKSN